MSQAKERPILFNGPMVRALLDGSKTVTRRAVKVQPRSKADIGSYGPGQPFIRNADPTKRNPECPYGRPGDRLWVRETLEVVAAWGVYYAASGPNSPEGYLDDKDVRGVSLLRFGDQHDVNLARQIPSIHMPRWASRLLLEITSVRVERLQDITPSQCIAEGAWREEDKELGRGHEAVDAFAELWRSTGGDWDANPWVWVVEFNRVQP